MRIGYARVSTEDQDLALQLDALNKAKCKKIYQENITGRTKERPEFQKLLDNLRPKDVIIIWKLDRLGRSLKYPVQLVNEIQEKGAGLKSLHDNIDTTTPQGKLTFHIFAALAEFEADMIRERTHAGLKAATHTAVASCWPSISMRNGRPSPSSWGLITRSAVSPAMCKPR